MREESKGVSAVTAAKRNEKEIERLYKVNGPIEERK